MAQTALMELRAQLAHLARPRKWPDPIGWIETHRRLSPESSRQIGPFRFAKAPYLEEPQRAILAREGGEVVLEWASQCGKSELLLNSLLYWSEIDPAPAMVITPDWKTAQSFSVDRVRPMLRDAKREVFVGKRSSKTINTMFHMMMGAMPLTIVHGSGASALAMRPIRYLIFDETSRLPASAKGRRGDEGDPVALAKVRTTSYADTAKVIYVSSPVEEGACRITELFEDSTRERWNLRCPFCGALQVLELSEMDFESASATCLQCGRSANQERWQATPGQWVAENPGHRRRGFWLNAFASPFIPWPTIFEEWRAACHAKDAGDFAQFRVVLHTRLCRNFSVSVQMMNEPEALMARREDYAFEVPDEARMIIASIDTQKTWLEYLVAAVGKSNEIWLLDTGSISGRIDSEPDALYALVETELLARQWKRLDGRKMALARVLQDAGYATPQVHRGTHARGQIMTAYKGAGDMLGAWKRSTVTETHSRVIVGNSSYYKDQLANRLEIEPPGPGSIHFGPEARGFDQEFFLQMLAERKESRLRRGVRSTHWVAIRERNEALDLVVMILCLIDTFRGAIDRMSGPQLVGERPKTSQGTQPSFGALPQSGLTEAPQIGSVPQPKPEQPQWGVANKPLQW